MLRNMGGVVVILNEVETEIDEGESHSIVATGFRRQKISQMFGNTFGKLSFSDDRGCKDGIGSCNAGSAAKRFDKAECWNQPPDDDRSNEPSKCHDR